MISELSTVSWTVISTWNREGSLGKNPEEGGWQERAGVNALLEALGPGSDLPGETKTDFLQPDVCWTKELERVGGGAAICELQGPQGCPQPKSVRVWWSDPFQPPCEEPNLPGCHRSLQVSWDGGPPSLPATNSESFLFLSSILVTASDSFTLSGC